MSLLAYYPRKIITKKELMANLKHLLKRILNRADLRKKNLHQGDLHQGDFRGVDLSGANLDEVDLSDANLLDLSGVILSGVDLRKKNLHQADLREAHLDEANLGGMDLVQADLREAVLNQANLREANLSKANLSGARLEGADLGEAHLGGVDLSGAYLGGANLSGANLFGADLSGANLFGADLSGANLSEANLSGADLSEANLDGADLYGANLDGADLSRAYLTKTRWNGTYLSNKTNFRESKFGSEHDVIRDSSDTICFSWRDQHINWSHLRAIGRFPLFGVSWGTLAFTILMINTIDRLNKLAEEHISLLIFYYQIPIPERTWWILISSILLVIGSTLYRISCPQRVQEFSETEWVEKYGHPRQLYLNESLSKPIIQWPVLFFTVIGGLIGIGLVIDRLWAIIMRHLLE